uniref:CD320 molecule n=1 Tax=Crocodylus porosus TaxID=8502 RepID=A0A7M4FZ92_CROPO
IAWMAVKRRGRDAPSAAPIGCAPRVSAPLAHPHSSLVRGPRGGGGPANGRVRAGPAPCPEHEFRCAPGGACFPRTWLCDGHDDCDHGEDERDCASPSAGAGGAGLPLGRAPSAARSQFSALYYAVLLSVLVGIGCLTAWQQSRKKTNFTSISLEKTSKEQLMPARRPSTTFP